MDIVIEGLRCVQHNTGFNNVYCILLEKIQLEIYCKSAVT